jgi:hypothetical protein
MVTILWIITRKQVVQETTVEKGEASKVTGNLYRKRNKGTIK